MLDIIHNSLLIWMSVLVVILTILCLWLYRNLDRYKTMHSLVKANFNESQMVIEVLRAYIDNKHYVYTEDLNLDLEPHEIDPDNLILIKHSDLVSIYQNSFIRD